MNKFEELRQKIIETKQTSREDIMNLFNQYKEELKAEQTAAEQRKDMMEEASN